MKRLAALAAVVLLAAACGRKAAPMAPELVRPESPSDLAASPVSDGVRVRWNRPLKYSGGQRMNDLGHFVVERAAEEGAPFVPVARVEVSDQERFKKERHLEWVDHFAQPGGSYLYRVTAVTLDGYRSPPAGPVAVKAEPAAESPASKAPPATAPSTK